MSHFLNREKLNLWLPKLIEKAEDEILLIVPYIKTSDTILKALKKANKDHKRIVVIYRENKLNANEKEKLFSLENLDLLHHPNIHCKCYFNGDLIIIGSMNLYEYSEKNNREMGYIINCLSEENANEIYEVDCLSENLFTTVNDAIEEIKEIVNGSTIEKKSKITLTEGFDLYITKTNFEKALIECDDLNHHFDNKKFEPVRMDIELSYLNFYDIVCSNYFDNINLHMESNRIGLHLKIDKSERLQIFNKWKKEYNLYSIKGFKTYWNNESKPIYLYKDKKYNFWSENENNDKKTYNAYKKGLKMFFEYYQKLKKEV